MRKQNRTFHVLRKPDICTCYEQIPRCRTDTEMSIAAHAAASAAQRLRSNRQSGQNSKTEGYARIATLHELSCKGQRRIPEYTRRPSLP